MLPKFHQNINSGFREDVVWRFSTIGPHLTSSLSLMECQALLTYRFWSLALHCNQVSSQSDQWIQGIRLFEHFSLFDPVKTRPLWGRPFWVIICGRVSYISDQWYQRNSRLRMGTILLHSDPPLSCYLGIRPFVSIYSDPNHWVIIVAKFHQNLTSGFKGELFFKYLAVVDPIWPCL